MPQIFDQLPSHLRSIAEQRLHDEVVGQICEDYDDVLAALDSLTVEKDAAKERNYANLKRLQKQLPTELIQILEEQRLRGNRNDGEK